MNRNLYVNQKRQIQASRRPRQIGVKHAESEIGVTVAGAMNLFGGGEMNAVVAAQAISRAELARPTNEKLFNLNDLPLRAVRIEFTAQGLFVELENRQQPGTATHVATHLSAI